MALCDFRACHIVLMALVALFSPVTLFGVHVAPRKVIFFVGTGHELVKIENVISNCVLLKNNEEYFISIYNDE